MTFSIIITAYNIEKYLHKCIRSVLSQTCSDYELILIDDGSTDKSGDICDRYAAGRHNVHVIHQDNKGISETRNAGIETARGEYIIFLDGDDYWYDRNCLEKLSDYIENNNVDVVTFLAVMHENIRKNDKVINILCESRNRNGYSFEEFMIKHLKINRYYNWGPWIYAFSRKLFNDKDMRFPAGRKCEDMYLVWRILSSAERIGVLPVKFYVYRNFRPGSITYRASCSFIEDFIWVLDRNFSDIRRNITDNEVKHHLLGSFSMYYVRCCAKASFLPPEDRRKMLIKLAKRKEYLSYAHGRQYHIMKKACDIIGFKNTVRLLHLYLLWQESGL